MSTLELCSNTIVCGIEVPQINGGFGEGKKAMLAKHIAEIHGKELKNINRAISMNRHRFRDYVDVIDVKNSVFEVHLIHHGILNQNAVNRASNIYVVSERGYAKLIKIFDDEQSWDLYDQLLDEYFDLREQAQMTQTQSPAEVILQLAQQLVDQEKKVSNLEHRTTANEEKVLQISDYLTEKPTREKINRRVIEYARQIGQRNINLAWGNIYNILKGKYGIDIPMRVERARARIQRDRIAEGKAPYAQKTLEKKVNGLDIVFQENFENEVMRIVTGLVSKAIKRG